MVKKNYQCRSLLSLVLFLLKIVQLGFKLNTKIALNHHHPPGTFRPVPDIPGHQDLVCRSTKGPGPKDQDQRTRNFQIQSLPKLNTLDPGLVSDKNVPS